MAVRRETSVKRWMGLSGDAKPSPGAVDPYDAGGNNYTIPAGSLYEESDTGVEWRWNGEAWRRYEPRDKQAEILEQVLGELHSMNEKLEIGLGVLH